MQNPIRSPGHRKSIFSIILLVLFAAPALVLAGLESYVKAPDSSFAWNVEKTTEIPDTATVLTVRLTSQTWKGIDWKHWLHVIRPEAVLKPDIGLLAITGGRNQENPPRQIPGEVRGLARIAQRTGTVIAVLFQVPNQPLLDDLHEDALIAFTFQKFLETRDPTWPCLLPMTKSAVRAMDTVQALLEKRYSQKIKRFVVTGASKRGWTTWLAAAVDPRVCAIAPRVIDVLNFSKQMPHQVFSFGTYSEQIGDYTELNLPQLMDRPEARILIDLVDPYSYRKTLTLPKLILLGTNDRYWPVDAIKLYFGDLPGEKYIHYVPNAGHGLGPGAFEAIAAFYQTVIAGETRPRFTWEFQVSEGEAILAITAKDKPEKAELWKADAPTRDFRDSQWSSAELGKSQKGRFEGRLPVPPKGFSALFGRLTFRSSLGHSYTLSTNVEVIGSDS